MSISRKEFLSLGLAGAAALMIMPSASAQLTAPSQRVRSPLPENSGQRQNP